MCVFCEYSNTKRKPYENYMFVVSIRAHVECDRHFINSMLNCESIVSSEFLNGKLNSFIVN